MCSRLSCYVTWRCVKLYQTCSDAILQGAFIEDVGGEGTERWVHTVLDLQADRSDPQHHQAFKQGLGEAGFGCLLTHHNRTQLAVISHQDELRRKKRFFSVMESLQLSNVSVIVYSRQKIHGVVNVFCSTQGYCGPVFCTSSCVSTHAADVATFIVKPHGPFKR